LIDQYVANRGSHAFRNGGRKSGLAWRISGLLDAGSLHARVIRHYRFSPWSRSVRVTT
jgi:hypothetical protein